MLLPVFKICYGYRLEGITHHYFNKDAEFLRAVNLVYRAYEGYGNICGEKTFEKLPQTLHDAIDDFEQYTEAQVAVVSLGPERDQTIVR